MYKVEVLGVDLYLLENYKTSDSTFLGKSAIIRVVHVRRGLSCLFYVPNATTMRHLYLLYFSQLIRRQFMRGTDPIKSTWVYPIF